MPEGRIDIDKEKCKGCAFCLKTCRNGVIALSLPEKTNKLGHRYLVAAKPDLCTGCGLCAQMCPDSVITVWRRRKK
jgi:2-oxoglutarate ferredoxin oxidoreductase subunit delta